VGKFKSLPLIPTVFNLPPFYSLAGETAGQFLLNIPCLKLLLPVLEMLAMQ
jgi:hypothetical protein